MPIEMSARIVHYVATTLPHSAASTGRWIVAVGAFEHSGRSSCARKVLTKVKNEETIVSAGKNAILVLRLWLFFLLSGRLLAFVGEKVNSFEKLVDVGRIVDRGSCFGRVFCTDATIATVRLARTRGHIWARSYGVVWAWLTRITRSHPSLSVSSLAQPSVLAADGVLDLSFFR